MSKHTPGPWLIGKGADGLPIIHTAPDSFSPSGQGVAHACKRPMCHEHEANALLMAAAPKMLATLQEIEPFLVDRADADHNGTTFVPNEAMRLLNELREAIAATGEA